MDVRSNVVFAQIETDAGITGYGEATNHFLPHASLGMLQDLTPYLIVEDPQRIESLWDSASIPTKAASPLIMVTRR